jgi:Uma2 family endonuclease
MSLDRFDRAVGSEGYIYELGNGVIEVTDVPTPLHGKQVQALRNQLTVYQVNHPDVIVIDFLAGSNHSKILLAEQQSERHPDLSVYLDPEPDVSDVWSIWCPAIVIEVVSKSSVKRDYEVKPAEYLSFGIDEYWIVDGFQQKITVLSRWRGQWEQKVFKPGQKYITPRLPGFSLEAKPVLSVR